MRALSDEGVRADAVVTDPPYGIEFMGRAWDAAENVAFRPETWAIALDLLKPGGYLAAFGGTRKFHRMACAIEDAGFELRDTIMWLYGSGFPKARSCLKPAWEPIIVARKPGPRVLALNIDGCRVAANGESLDGGKTRADYAGCKDGWRRPFQDDAAYMAERAATEAGKVARAEALGRWPANLCHDGSEEVLDAFAQFGTRTSGVLKAGTQRNGRSVCYGKMPDTAALQDFGGDTGSAARFFYCAKASKAERDGSKHPTVKPLALMRWLCRLVTPPGGTILDPFAGSGTTGEAAILEGFRPLLIEREAEYLPDISRRLTRATPPLFAVSA